MSQKLKYFIKLLLCFIPITALCDSPAGNHLEVVHNANNGTQIYVNTDSNKRILAYETNNFLERDNSDQMSAGINNNILWITVYDKNTTIAIFSDLRSNKVFSINSNDDTGNDNYKTKVTLLYNKEKNIYTIIPILEPCKNPITYQPSVKTIGPELGSHYLKNGNLFIATQKMPGGDEYNFIIPINYQKFFADCRGN
jgi:hypothetical protein